MDKLQISCIIKFIHEGANIIMKNKLIKMLNVGLYCIVFSLILSTYIPQNNKMALAITIPTHTNINTPLNIDPPFVGRVSLNIDTPFGLL